MVCHTEPSVRGAAKTVWEKGQIMADDWLNHLSITVYHWLNSPKAAKLTSSGAVVCKHTTYWL